MKSTVRSWIPLLCLTGLGVALYLGPALKAPVVLWSDSQIDIAWAKAGLGIFRPIPPPPPGVPIGHLPKPGYLLFLRLAMGVLPWFGEPRSIVVTQSALLVLSILGTSLWLGRRRGASVGLGLALCCLLFLRLRDASSGVMTEALTTALLLPIAALLLHPPGRRGAASLGLSAGALFLIRPNCGGAMLLLAITSLAAAREGRRLFPLLGGFVILVLPFWYLGRPNLPGDPLHGLGFQIVEGSADYYWAPSIHPWPVGQTPAEASRREARFAWEKWKQALAGPEPDRSRQLVWRGLHGLLGIEYSDFRWSKTYAAVATASRLLSPFLILAAIAVLFTMPSRPRDPAKLAGLLLLILTVGQSLLLGSNPRYAIPFLPAIFLFAICGVSSFKQSSGKRRLALAITFAGLLLFAALQRHVLDWQWGRVESAGVTLRQKIERGGLPARAPATLHLRIAAPDPNSGAHWTLSAAGRPIASSGTIPDRASPVVTVEIPPWLLEESRHASVDISISSTGSFGETSYLLFPVVPPPWARPARRDGSEELSPTTGVRWGALDWWAHEGSEGARTDQRN